MAGFAPVHRIAATLNQTFLPHLEENPLAPTIVFLIARAHRTIPVVGKAHALEHVALGFDIAVRPRGGMTIMLDCRVFRRKTESVPTHRMKHVITAHLGIAGDNVTNGIVARMAHMRIARRIREHFEHIFLRLGRILGHDVLAALLPYRLPSRLYFMRVVFFHLQLLMIARCMASRPLKHEFVLLYGGMQE